MKVRLIGTTVRPKGSPISLRIEPVTFDGEDATAILSQIKAYFADEVIPNIPFTRKDDEAREMIRRMSNGEMSRMLVEYYNTEYNPDIPVPANDFEALQIFEKAGLLVVLHQN